jgi:hypothetical protein
VVLLAVAATTLGLTAFDLNNPSPQYHSVPPPLLVSTWNVSWSARFPDTDVGAAPGAQLLGPLSRLNATKSFSSVVAVADNASVADAWLLRGMLHVRDYRHALNTSALESFYRDSNDTDVVSISLVMQDLANVKARTYSPVKAWLMLFTLVGMLSFLLKENAIAPDVVLILALCFLALVGIITVDETLAGFSNSGIATVGILFVIATAIGNSGVLDLMSRFVLRNPASVTSASLSPHGAGGGRQRVHQQHADRRAHDPRRDFVGPEDGCRELQAAHAALVRLDSRRHGHADRHQHQPDCARAAALPSSPTSPCPSFEMSQVGLPLAFVGILYIALIGHRLLPSNASLSSSSSKTVARTRRTLLWQRRARW